MNSPDPNITRILDAAANRAQEALRVIEDYLRFALDDAHLTQLAKQLRHDLRATLAPLPMTQRLTARQTETDVGTTLSTASEMQRASSADVVQANFARLEESLRSLEEFSKVVQPETAQAIEQLRYRTYTLHRAVGITVDSVERLREARLYVLIDGRNSLDEFQSLARSLVEAGVDVLQLRDKTLDDRALLARAKALREITKQSTTLFIMNDRPDLTVLADADGVHVGQEELSVRDVRKIIGLEKLIGVSTHNVEQARQAVIDGANYLGVGPTFPSTTKTFDTFAGLDFVRQVAAEIRLPAFAIGGITADNAPEVFAAGLTRVAMQDAIINADDPPRVARRLQREIRLCR